MKRIKKLASLALAMIMVLAMTMTASATQLPDENGGETAPKTTDRYQIYQIFSGDFSDGVLSNVKWGSNASNNGSAVTVGDPVPNTILEELAGEHISSDDDPVVNDENPDNFVTNAASDAAQLDVIKKYVNLNSTAFATEATENADGSITFNGLVPGYYLIRDNTSASVDDEPIENEVYTLYVVRVVDTSLTFMPKVDVPTSDKKIVLNGTEAENGANVATDENKVDANQASIGDIINYEITGTLPSNIASYESYYYVFTDTLSAGLTYDPESVKVFVGEGTDLAGYTNVTGQFYKGATTSDAGVTTITVGVVDLLKLTDVTITSATNIVVQYNATLNENAVIAGEGNPNDVDLTYSNDPNKEQDGRPNNPDEPPTPVHPTGVTPEAKVKTFTTELEITKIDGTTKNVLQGAEFTLTGEGVNVVLVTEAQFNEDANGEYWKLTDGTYTKTAPTVGGAADNTGDYDSTETKYAITTAVVVAKGTGKTSVDVSGIVDENGVVKFTGLGAGTYWLEETKTPPGYNTLTKFQFEIKADPTDDGKGIVFTVPEDSIKDGDVAGEGNVLTDIVISNGTVTNTFASTIENNSGSLLPSTGGIGTTIFYVVGGILVVAAGILLVTKKRMSAR